MNQSNNSDRINNSVRNVFYGTINYVIAFIFPFILRTVIIYKFGSEYAGINSLFSSILQVLNLSELGFSTAVVYALYEPIAKNDNEKICVLLSFFRKVYRYIGLFILGMGVCICPFIQYMIKGSYPSDINIYVIFLLLLINTSLSYLFFGYKSIIFVAYQRSDMTSKTQLASNIAMYILQIFALVVIENYYVYIICMIVGTLTNNVLMERNSKRMYPEIVCRGELQKEERNSFIKKIGTLFGHQLDVVIITSADNIVISSFLGLKILAIYGNYSTIINAAISLLIMVAHSFAASIGNSLAIETKEKNYKNFIDFTYMLVNLSGIFAILMFVLFNDFMNIWMGSTRLLNGKIVLMLSVCFFIRMAKRPGNTYKVEQGLWDADMLKPYVAGISNLILNIISVKIIGLYGVILSTIISLGLIEMPWETYVLFKHYFKKGLSNYLMMLGYTVLKLLLIGAIAYFETQVIQVNGVVWFLVKAFAILITVLFLFVLFSYRDKEYQYFWTKLKEIVFKKKKNT